MSTDVPRNQMFTARQEHIIALVADGYTAREIADHLDITRQAVYKHAQEICELLFIPIRHGKAFAQLIEWIDTWRDDEE